MSEYNINSQWTLLERAKRSVDGKKILPILDVMDQVGVPDFLGDVPTFEANQGLKHRIVRTVSRPSSTRRKFYSGVGATKTGTQVIYEDVTLFEQRSEIDEDHLDTLENPKEARRQEDEGHIAALLEDVVKAIFQDAKTSGEEYIDGFGARLDSLSYPGHTTSSYPYVWDGGASSRTGYLCSMWIVEWGAQANHMLYPSGNRVRGGRYGLIARDKGKEKIADTDDSTHFYYSYVSQFKMWAGLACWDDRKVARIANIDQDYARANSFNENIVIQALNHGRFRPGRTRIYVNPYLASQIDIRANSKSNTLWGKMELFGASVRTARGVPIRVLDEVILPATETSLS